MNDASHTKPRLLSERRLVVLIVALIASFWLFLFGAIFSGRHIAMCMMEMPGSCENALQSVIAKGQVRQPLVFAQANKLVGDEKADEAIALVKTEIANGLRNKATLQFVGNLQKQASDTAAAANSFREALDLDPNDKDLVADLVLALRDNNDNANARLVINRFIVANPNDAWGYSWLTWLERLAGNHLAALAAADNAIALERKNAEHHRDRASALQNLQRWEEAVASLDKAIVLAPDNTGNRYERASTLVTLGKFDLARSDYLEIIKINQDASSHIDYAVFEFDQDNLDNAMLHTDEAIKIESENEQALALRIRLLIAKQQFDLAQSALAKFETDFEKNTESIQLSAELLDARGEEAKAIDLYKSLLTQWENFAWLRVQIGEAYIDIQSPEQSFYWFEQALKINPHEAPALSGMARGHIALKQWDKALGTAKSLIEKQPHRGISYARRGQAYQGLSQNDLAIKDYRRALELDPKLNWVKEDLALLLEQTGRSDEAAKLRQTIRKQ